MDDAELRALIAAVSARLTGSPEQAAREAFMRRDARQAVKALESGSERAKREALAALRTWVP